MCLTEGRQGKLWLKHSLSDAKPWQSCGGRACCEVHEQVAIKISLEEAHTLEHLIALFLSIHLSATVVIVPNTIW